MQNIIVFYGGKSVEHDISILTAIQALNNINNNKYNVIPIYLTKNNQFIIVQDYLNPKIYIEQIKKYKKVSLNFGDSSITIKGIKSKKIHIDCAINCCHGFNGEDGTLTALMNLCNIPLTSSSILGSSTCMDKVIMKDIFVANSIPCVDYCLITKLDYTQGNYLSLIKQKLSYPLIIKPSNLGSSIGITKASCDNELQEALEIAFYYDDRVIVETCLTDFKEINIACLGNQECELSSLEQPLSWQDFLNFDDKYTQNTQSTKILNPDLDIGVLEQIQQIAKKLFKIFNLSGVIRIDFMLKNNTVYVNEINTVPGSLSFYLWKSKYEFFELIDRLIDLAIQRHLSQSVHKYTFNSNVLVDYKPNGINKYSNK